jgi:uncharacterized SAM-binding protein YcdF (DUF218 family)
MKKLLGRFLALLLLIACLWAAGFVYYISAAMMMRPVDTTEMPGAIVVLTGGQQRVETGLDLFARAHTRVPYLFISGVNPKVTESEIRARAPDVALLPECCIILGQSARTTFQNAQETEKWVRETNVPSIRLVTANYHMKRAMLEFSSVLHGVKIYAHPVVQPGLEHLNRRLLNLLFSEYNKYLVRFVPLTYHAIVSRP